MMQNSDIVDPLEKQIYDYVRKCQPVTRKMVQSYIGNVTSSSIIKVLETLVDKKLINRHDRCGIGSTIKYTSDDLSLISNPVLRRTGIQHLLHSTDKKEEMVKNCLNKGFMKISDIAVNTNLNYATVQKILRKLNIHKTIFD